MNIRKKFSFIYLVIHFNQERYKAFIDIILRNQDFSIFSYLSSEQYMMKWNNNLKCTVSSAHNERLQGIYERASQNRQKSGNFMKNHDISDKILHFELNNGLKVQ